MIKQAECIGGPQDGRITKLETIGDTLPDGVIFARPDKRDIYELRDGKLYYVRTL